MNIRAIGLLFFFSILFEYSSYTQESIIKDVDNSLLQKYITLALQNYPRKVTYDERIKRAKSALNTSNLTWLDPLYVGYFRTQNGEIGVSGSGGGSNSQLFVNNGFQFGVNVSLGNLLSKPSIVRQAKIDYNIAKAESADYNMTLISQVKNLYYDYLLAKKQLELRNFSNQSLNTLLNEAKSKYERAEISLDVYTTSKNSVIESEASLLSAENSYLKAKNALEMIIGTQLENVK